MLFLNRSDTNTSELINEVNKLSEQNRKLEKLCRKLNKKLRASEKQIKDLQSNPANNSISYSKSTPILDLDRDGGASVSGSIMSNEDSVSLSNFIDKV